MMTEKRSLAWGFWMCACIALFWGAQHTLQGPFYKSLLSRFDYIGIIIGILCAELLIALFYATWLFLSKDYRSVAGKEIIKWENCTFFFKAGSYATVSIALYATSQAFVEGVDISILLNLSPVAVVLAMSSDKENKRGLSLLDRVKLAFKVMLSKRALVCVHVVLGLVTLGILFLASDESLSAWKDAFSVWMILPLIVPVFYFWSESEVRAYFPKENKRTQRAALVVSGFVIAATLSMLIAVLLHVLFGIDNNLSWRSVFDLVKSDFFTFSVFVVGQLCISVAARLLLHRFRDYSEDNNLDIAEFIFHATPFFSFVVLVLFIFVFHWNQPLPSLTKALVIIPIFFTLAIYYGWDKKRTQHMENR